MTGRLAIAGAIGTAACLALDALHVASGTAYYAHPVWVGGLAWWVPVSFAAANAILLGGTATIPHPASRAAPIALDGVLFVGAYAGSSFVGSASAPYALALVLVWVLRVARRPPWVALHAFVVAAAGCAVEAALGASGLFVYVRPDVAGIPWWLPGIYLHAAGVAVTVTGREAA